jgi:hypothetical protein
MREPNARVEFKHEDFEFSEQKTATAKTQKILGIDWNRLFLKETGGVNSDQSAVSGLISVASLPVIGTLLIDNTANYALYEIMTENPGYDLVFYPQYSTKVKRPILGLGFLYKEIEVTAITKLAKIK